jgi:hypothetical protein
VLGVIITERRLIVAASSFFRRFLLRLADADPKQKNLRVLHETTAMAVAIVVLNRMLPHSEMASWS